MKGQIISIEASLSVMIVAGLIVSAFISWDFLQEGSVRKRNINEIQQNSLRLSSSVLESPGIPPYWNESAVDIPGIGGARWPYIDLEKMTAFSALNEKELLKVTERLGLGGKYWRVELFLYNSSREDSALLIAGYNMSNPIHVSITSRIIVTSETKQVGKVKAIVWDCEVNCT